MHTKLFTISHCNIKARLRSLATGIETRPRHLAAAAVVWVIAFAFSSCSDREEELLPVDGRVPATFTPAIGSSVKSHSASSRVTSDTIWSAGDQVGICMVKAGSTTVADRLVENIPYKTTADGIRASLIPVNDPIYYPVDGSKVNFVAYYPYKESFIASTSYYLSVASQGTALATDLLHHKDEEAYSQYDASATLTFKHIMSKIIINVNCAPGVTTDITSLAAKINKIPTYGGMDLYSGKFGSLSGIKTITPKKTSSATDKSVHEAILIPHKGAGYADRSITFTVGDITYTYPISTVQDFKSGYIYTYNFTLTQTEIVLYEATIEDWNAKGELTYGAPSNCYILKPGGNTIAIPVSRANEYIRQLGETEEFTASILWNDGNSEMISLTKSKGTGYKDYIHVTSNADESMVGNAVVTLNRTTGNKEVLWSWHIWVVDYDPNAEGATWKPDAGSTNPRTTFMDRNLGATTTVLSGAARGTYYQWGRKDPFPKIEGVEGYSAESAGTGVSITTTIQHPGVFYYNATSPYDWHETRNSYLWVTQDDKKTIFDPCPVGWRVPTSGTGTASPWYGLKAQSFTTTVGGVSWDPDSNNWPAGGYRTSSAGTLASRGGTGYYWAATTYGTSCYRFAFSTNSISTNANNGNRAAGNTVRCVKDN